MFCAGIVPPLKKEYQESMETALPKYRRVKQLLLDALAAGTWKPHDPMPSLAMIARRYRVSDITARRVVRELVREGWVYTVRGKGCFAADRPAGGELPSSRDPRRVVFLISYVLNYFYGAILEGVLGVLRPLGYVLDVQTTFDRDQLIEEYLARLLREKASGVLFMPAHAELSYYPVVQLAERGVPTVLVDRESDRLSCDYVACDHAAGMRLALRTLLRLGHRRIILLGGNPSSPALSSVSARLAAYRSVLEEAGCFDPALIVPEDPTLGYRDDLDIGRALVSRLPDRGVSFSAVIAMTDELAVGATDALRAARRNVPRDASVLSFDDSPLAREAPVPLTVIAQPAHDIGRAAAGMLVRRMRGRCGEPRRMLLRPHLIMRASVGRAPVKSTRRRRPRS